MISFERRESDQGRKDERAAAGFGQLGDQQRRIGRRLPGGSPAQNRWSPPGGAVTTATHGVTSCGAVSCGLGIGDTVPFRAVNTSSRHGPHSAVPGTPITVSDSYVGNAMQGQNPGSSFSIPSAEMQTEPPTSGGR